MKPKKQLTFFESKKNQKRFRTWFYLSLVVLLSIDLTAYFLFERHGHFPWESVPFFNAVYGFTACVGLIFIARILRFIVKRREDYYD